MAKKPAPKVNMLATDSLDPYAKNARKHSAGQVSQIAKSITEFGFTNPVLIDKRKGILAGHGRVLAAIQLGMDRVPTIALDHLTKKQARAYIIADNKLTENATWDIELLSSELFDLSGHGFDLSLMGFSDPELGRLLGSTVGGEDDELEPPADPTTKPGDIYEMDGHRLICGDATDKETVAMILRDDAPHLMVTDPPFGVKYDPNQRSRVRTQSKRSYMPAEKDTELSWCGAWSLFSGDVCYIWHSDKQIIGIGESLISCGFNLRQQLVWAKDSLTMTRAQFHYQHEHCWYAIRKGKGAHWVGGHDQTTLWQIDKVNASTGHGAQKPTECMKRPMENNSKRGDFVYDPFVGSGTSIIAAEILNRRCLAIELDPGYCDVAVARWESHTGEKAKLVGGGNGKA